MTTYDQIDAVNISTLKLLWSHSPLHYRRALETAREATPAMRLGTAVHVAVLEPARYADSYAVRPAGIDGRTRDGKAWLAEHEHDEVLTAVQDGQCRAMAEAVRACPDAARLLAEGRPEVVLEWTDAATGVRCKGRADWITPSGDIIGLKTTRDIRDRPFGGQAETLGYHLQWAYYHDAMVALGTPPLLVAEIVVESAPPHDVALVLVGDDTLEAGRKAYRDALATLVRCRATGEWPGVAPKPRLHVRPAWSRTDQEWEVDSE